MEDLYKRIERLGKEHGYKNITALCTAAGVPRANMTELNKGRTMTISLQNAMKFAETLNCSVEYLLDVENKKSPSPVEDELSEVKKKVLDRLNKMSDQEVQKVIELLDVLDPMFK